MWIYLLRPAVPLHSPRLKFFLRFGTACGIAAVIIELIAGQNGGWCGPHLAFALIAAVALSLGSTERVCSAGAPTTVSTGDFLHDSPVIAVESIESDDSIAERIYSPDFKP